MKKNCNGCRALCSYGCDLGKKTTTEVKEIMGFRNVTRIPLEECPKPKTYSLYLSYKT